MQEKIRLAAFDWLTKQTFFQGDVLPRELLAQGFDFGGQRVPLLGPQGIFKPRIMKLPLSITTSPNSPYKDRSDKDGNWLYSYRERLRLANQICHRSCKLRQIQS